MGNAGAGFHSLPAAGTGLPIKQLETISKLAISLDFRLKRNGL